MVAIRRRGCTIIERRKLKSVISSKKCDDILDYDEVLRDFCESSEIFKILIVGSILRGVVSISEVLRLLKDIGVRLF